MDSSFLTGSHDSTPGYSYLESWAGLGLIPLSLLGKLGQKWRHFDEGHQQSAFFAMHLGKMAPEVGLEPTTNRLTADRSTTELLRNVKTEV